MCINSFKINKKHRNIKKRREGTCIATGLLVGRFMIMIINLKLVKSVRGCCISHLCSRYGVYGKVV